MKRIPAIFTHILFLAGFLSFPLLLMPPLTAHKQFNDAGQLFRSVILTNFLAASAYYLNYYYLIPSFNTKRKYKAYTVSLLLIAAVILLVPVLCNFIMSRLHIPFPFVNSLRAPLPSLLMTAMALMLSFILHKNNEWKQAQRDKMEMEMQKNAAEVSLLRNQVNPHFFFNMLNGIYSMAIRQSTETPAAVLQLSQLMRYVLYESEGERVPLEKEIEYMSGYVKMQHMRLSGNNTVNFEVRNTSSGLTIAPLLMIPFIENCFKYGTSGNHDTKMNISLDCNGKRLLFSSNNTIIPGKIDPDHKGIGINNVKRRLELIYPDRYSLSIRENEHEFAVHLEMEL
ncbi:sensor histidine kinase [Chitinophaga tropicalis]|uniref:Signal transduction histidine kinase internal region domain-containing protein n=1 Tax=Chitinophaga tropicalis TaxID=2683588 RepID=A0A7K1U7I8_9BACT|nr:histidine kinase [Chitinophaga tropicalis]MVT10256.1 hypothetical protein [Chitinophaga tropicalis]